MALNTAQAVDQAMAEVVEIAHGIGRSVARRRARFLVRQREASARAAHDVAEARVDAVRAEVSAKDALIHELRELLADARRP